MSVLFEDPQSLADYYTRVSGRLQERLSGRILFLEECRGRLQALRDVAEALEETSLAGELEEHLAAADAELASLSGLQSDARMPAAPLGLEQKASGGAPPLEEARPAGPAVPSRRNRRGSKPDSSAMDRADLPEREPEPAPEAVKEPQPEAAADATGPTVAGPTVAGKGVAGKAVLPEGFPGWDTNFSAAPEPRSAEASAGAAAPAEPGGTAPSPRSLTLEIQGRDREWAWSMEGGTAVLGRHSTEEAVHPEVDLWPDLAVSRRHASITARDGRFYLQDLNSANGTTLNGGLVPPFEDVELRNGDVILVGDGTVLCVRMPQVS